ncbi:MAG: hypothetical protein AB7O63_12435 [Reyranellaceae bacterium]
MTHRANSASDSSLVEAGVSRRQALTIGLGGLIAAAGVVAFGRQALAFTILEADAPAARAFHNACGGVRYHDALAAEVRQLLRRQGDTVPEKVDCPVCGCGVALAPAPDQPLSKPAGG